MAGRLLFRLLSALVASTGMTTFGEILSLRHGTSSRETPDIKDGLTLPTLLTRDVAIRLLPVFSNLVSLPRVLFLSSRSL